MAASSLLGSVWDTTSGTHTVTATPSAGDLIVIVTANSGSTTTTAGPTDNNSAGTYTLVNTAVKATSADTLQVWVRTALITSAVSTIFTQAPGTTTGGGMAVIRVAGTGGLAGSSAILRSAIQSNQAASTTPAPVLSAVPATQSTVIGAVFSATNSTTTATPRTGYTELVDVGYNTPASGLEVMSLDGGETSATITWGGTVASAWCAIALEVASPALSTVTENFEAALDSAKWFTFTNNTSAVSLVSGELDLSPSATNGSLASISLQNSYSLSESSVYVKLSRPLNSTTGVLYGVVTSFTVLDRANSGNYVEFYQTRTTTGYDLYSKVATNNVGTDTLIGAYDATNHAWLRIRKSGGTVFWDTAPTTASNPPVSGDWVNRSSTSTLPGPFTNAQARLQGGYNDTGTGSVTQTARFDGFNTAANASAIALGAALAGASAVTAGLTTQITPAGALAALTTITAGLTTAIRPAASLAGGTSLTAGLTTSITPAANLGADSTITAALTTAIQMAASLIGAASASADLTAGEAVLEAGRLGGFVIDKTDSALWWKRKPKKISEPVARQKIAKVAERLTEVAQQAQQPTQKAAHAAIAPLLVSMPGFDWTALYRVIVAQENARRAHAEAQRAIEKARRAWEQDEEDALILLMTH